MIWRRDSVERLIMATSLSVSASSELQGYRLGYIGGETFSHQYLPEVVKIYNRSLFQEFKEGMPQTLENINQAMAEVLHGRAAMPTMGLIFRVGSHEIRNGVYLINGRKTDMMPRYSPTLKYNCPYLEYGFMVYSYLKDPFICYSGCFYIKTFDDDGIEKIYMMKRGGIERRLKKFGRLSAGLKIIDSLGRASIPTIQDANRTRDLEFQYDPSMSRKSQ